MAVSKERIQSYLKGEIGKEMVIYDKIDSTTNAAKLLAKNAAPHGSVVIALQQTSGKGRLGRSFYSPEATGIYMTAILRPTLPVQQVLQITSAAAVAVSRGIKDAAGIETQIKWVNDVYYQGKKLCGILTESSVENGKIDYAVVGIGINVSTDTFPQELKEKATCLSHAAGQVDSDLLIARVLDNLDEVYSQLGTGAFMEEYRARSCVIGKEVTVLNMGEPFIAKAVDIDNDAHLIVKTADERYLTISSGEVTLQGDWK